MKPPALATAGQLAALRAAAHPRCVVCSPSHPSGLRLECTVGADGAVEAVFAAEESMAGYVGRLHGGIVAALLDGAMTQCLFAHGCQAFTAELTVRYRHPVATAEPLKARAWLSDSRGPLHLLRAELRQGGQVKATALGKFMESHA